MVSRITATFLAAFCFVGAANAAVVSISGPVSSRGASPAIIAPPADLTNNGYTNDGIEVFDELQSVLLGSSIVVDGPSLGVNGSIPAGTFVDSHMVVFNKATGTPGRPTHGLTPGAPLQITFDGTILGVMSDFEWSMVAATNAILGLPAVDYGVAEDGRGMDFDPFDGVTTNDFYSFSGSVLTIGLRVVQPGDWIRVVTAPGNPGPPPPPVPLPAPALLLLGGLAALAGLRRRA
jgi:hypothetical protein